MHKMRVIYGCKFFRCQIKIVILPGSCNKAYWEQSFSGNWDRDSAIVLQKADKGLNSSQAQTWAKGSIIVLLQVPAPAAREKKSIQGGHKEQWKSWSLSNAALMLQNIPLHKRVNKDSVDFSFLLGEVPALSNNLIIHHSLQGKQSGPWRRDKQRRNFLLACLRTPYGPCGTRPPLLTDAIQIQLHRGALQSNPTVPGSEMQLLPYSIMKTAILSWAWS